MGVVLDRKTVNVLTLPDDKTEKLFLDSIIEGFGLRLRVERVTAGCRKVFSCSTGTTVGSGGRRSKRPMWTRRGRLRPRC